MSGKLIVFEGGEGCGKTTQIQYAEQWLTTSSWIRFLQSQHQVDQLVVTREPGGTELGQGLRQLLLQPSSQETIQDRAELLLYAADRAQHVEAFLRPLLTQNALILCDRYTASTIAYQGYGRGLNLDLIHQLNHIATQGLESDLTLWLDLEPEQGLARVQKRSGQSDRMEQSSLEFHRRVRQGFSQLAQEQSGRMVRLDASPTAVEVAQQVQQVLTQWLIQWYGERPV